MKLLKNLFGNKDDNYYLELKETAEDVVASAQETTENVLSSVQEVVENKADKAKEVVVEKTSVAKEAVAEKTATAKKKVNNKATPVKEKAQVAESQSKQTPATKASNKVPTYEPPFWVKAMYSNSNNGNGNGKAAQSEKTFATDNLMPVISNARRRPGPSLNKFKDMANKARTPRG